MSLHSYWASLIIGVPEPMLVIITYFFGFSNICIKDDVGRESGHSGLFFFSLASLFKR
jgi:hypothetical protein